MPKYIGDAQVWRAKLAPQKDWEVNNRAELVKVLKSAAAYVEAPPCG